MVQRPDTKYVGVGDADVAYQVIGDGPNDVLYFYGIGSHVEVQWTMPDFDDFIERLLRFSRVIVFDRRGTGASDGIAEIGDPHLRGVDRRRPRRSRRRRLRADRDHRFHRRRAGRAPVRRAAPREGERGSSC